MRLLSRCIKRVPSRTNQGRSSFSTTSTKPPLCVVDLRGAGWSLLERLCVEEFLTQTKPKQSWLVIGNQEPTYHRHLHLKEKAPLYIEQSILAGDDYNPACAVVVEDVSQLNTEMIQQDGILCFEGHSFLEQSVVLDHSSVITSLIAQEDDHATPEFMTEQLWKPTFDVLEDIRVQSSSPTNKTSPLTMVLDTKSCSKGDNSGRLVSLEDLGIVTKDDLGVAVKEDQTEEKVNVNSPLPISYQPFNNLLLGEFLIGKVHASEEDTGSTTTKSVRSCFWWDYDEHDHVSYLNQPQRPLKLETVYPSQAKLFEVLQTTCRDEFEVTQMNPRDITRMMAQEKSGLQEWWEERSTWKIVQKF